jgi:hypothetical protein
MKGGTTGVIPPAKMRIMAIIDVPHRIEVKLHRQGRRHHGDTGWRGWEIDGWRAGPVHGIGRGHAGTILPSGAGIVTIISL